MEDLKPKRPGGGPDGVTAGKENRINDSKRRIKNIMGGKPELCHWGEKGYERWGKGGRRILASPEGDEEENDLVCFQEVREQDQDKRTSLTERGKKFVQGGEVSTTSAGEMWGRGGPGTFS